jgi:peroxiredoxin
VVLGASFDNAQDNKAFKDTNNFEYPLLSADKATVGAAYEVTRADDHPYANFPERFSYLIDPSGVIRAAYDVKDPAGHAEVVLADLANLK